MVIRHKKYTYFFQNGYAEGCRELINILGNKGVGLAEMSKLNMPVPPGFTISSELCSEFSTRLIHLPKFLKIQIMKEIGRIAKVSGLKFGCKNNPLLLSVRSSAKFSMPGMMETILNLGLNNEIVIGLGETVKDLRFAYDLYRIYIEMYGNIILGIEKSQFERILNNSKRSLGIIDNCYLSVENLKNIINKYFLLVHQICKKPFPQNIDEQLWESISSIFKSWNTKRAIKYRKLNNIPDDLGTAVNIQSMVFGNKNNRSASGVAFTRNPSNGKKEIFGEYILNAQGEDIVSGIKTPCPINIKSKCEYSYNKLSLEEIMPKTYVRLEYILRNIELHYKDVQDVEFTIEDEQCWILQTRAAQRTDVASIRILINMFDEGIINKKEVLKNLELNTIEKILYSTIDPKAKKILLTKGLPASPGIAFGKIMLSSDKAKKMSLSDKVILVKTETSTEDIIGIDCSEGILTCRGGITSHAAVVARGIGKPSVTGASDIYINEKENIVKIKDYILKEGDFITIDGSNGEIFFGKLPTIKSRVNKYFDRVINITESYAKLKVLANAETVKDAIVAKSFGANGIGLCRTEHMFFQSNRINIFRKMIFANDNERISALDNILPYQQEDFFQLFRIMNGLPVTIRLLDLPLHEFLPSDNNKQLEELSRVLLMDIRNVRDRVNKLKEVNPMLGHRGCRLAVTHPEIYQMQITAILTSVYHCMKKNIIAIPEIMVPLVINKLEFMKIKTLIDKTAKQLEKTLNTKFQYKVGSMIELPSAVINSSEIAREADFISFGTNDLTQTCLGISRDDANKFLEPYIANKIFGSNPFQTIDEKTVGTLIKIAIQRSRKSNPNIKIGICGEHAGDSRSIKFFNSVNIDYVSCSPFRIPVAKIATAKYNC